jgi:hypothetical protein
MNDRMKLLDNQKQQSINSKRPNSSRRTNSSSRRTNSSSRRTNSSSSINNNTTPIINTTINPTRRLSYIDTSENNENLSKQFNILSDIIEIIIDKKNNKNIKQLVKKFINYNIDINDCNNEYKYYFLLPFTPISK